ncbi:Exosome complex exonuclease RRP42, partial [Mucuna pruriens]
MAQATWLPAILLCLAPELERNLRYYYGWFQKGTVFQKPVEEIANNDKHSRYLRMVGLSLGEKHFIQGGIAQDLRCDGRKRLTYRPISVETGVIPQANGSARVRMGATDVIASVKAELGKPSLSQPDKGKVSIYIDCSSTAEPAFEVAYFIAYLPSLCVVKSSCVLGRGGDELAAELSNALQRCLLGGKSGAGAGIDLSSLIVVEGKICWDLYIDGLVVSSDGNLLDALGAAIKVQLKM